MENSFQQGRQLPVVFKGNSARQEDHCRSNALTVYLGLALVLTFKTPFVFFCFSNPASLALPVMP